jgi:hypothetical protein
MNNVIAFPRGKKNSPPQSMEEVMESVEAVRKEHIEFLVDECCSFLFGRLLDEGFDLGDEDMTKPTLLVIESLKAALYAASGLEHPLHYFADQVLRVEENNEEVLTTDE